MKLKSIGTCKERGAWSLGNGTGAIMNKPDWEPSEKCSQGTFMMFAPTWIYRELAVEEHAQA
jgi:hypothetical protein